MNLKEAKKIWPDAISLTLKHNPNNMTESSLIKMTSQLWNDPVKPVFIKIGKASSRIIYSKLAAQADIPASSMTENNF